MSWRLLPWYSGEETSVLLKERCARLFPSEVLKTYVILWVFGNAIFFPLVPLF